MKQNSLTLLCTWVFLCVALTMQSAITAQLPKLDSIPDQWRTTSSYDQTLPVDDQWWSQFQDPILDKLIGLAVDNNYDVLSATYRMDQSRSMMRSAQTGFYPKFDIGAGLNVLPGLASPHLELNMNWEIDIIGAVRNRAQAKKELYQASKAEYNGVMISLCAQLATTYVNLRMLQQQLEIAERNITSQGAIVLITEGRFNSGLVAKLDVAQAKSVFFNTQATIPSLKANIHGAITALSVLVGKYPDELRSMLEVGGQLPVHPPMVGVGTPASLLRRRPDIRAAESTLSAQASTVGASIADWLPKFFITGSVGLRSDAMSNFGNGFYYQVAPAMKWSIFQGGQELQQLNIAKAQLEEQVAQYNNTVLKALQEVDHVMSIYEHSKQQIISLRQVVSQGQLTLSLSTDLYKQGLIDFQNVLDAQRSLLSYENALSTAEASSLISLVNLYQALGGGWVDLPSNHKKNK